MKNFLTQWETEEENLRINLMKNLLIQWKTEEENQKIAGSVPPIDRTPNCSVLFIDRAPNGGVLLIDRELAELEDNAEYASLPKLTELVKLSKLIELVKKPSSLARTGKEKPNCPISYSLACFVEPIGRPGFCFAEGLTGGLTDGLPMGRAASRGEEVAVGFSG